MSGYVGNTFNNDAVTNEFSETSQYKDVKGTVVIGTAEFDYKGHGRVDLPHVVINLGYDFGKGWSMGTEIEFEHGGSEVAVEIEAEETGEFEH